jgi:hypothetical protein
MVDGLILPLGRGGVVRWLDEPQNRFQRVVFHVKCAGNTVLATSYLLLSPRYDDTSYERPALSFVVQYWSVKSHVFARRYASCSAGRVASRSDSFCRQYTGMQTCYGRDNLRLYASTSEFKLIAGSCLLFFRPSWVLLRRTQATSGPLNRGASLRARLCRRKGGLEVLLLAFTTEALDGRECFASRSGRCIPRKVPRHNSVVLSRN